MVAEARYYYRMLGQKRYSYKMNSPTKSNILIDAFYNKVTSISCIERGMFYNSPLSWLLYRDLKSEDAINFFIEDFRLPKVKAFNAGHKLLLVASALVSSFGTYEPIPDIIIIIGSLRIPLWYSSDKVYINYKPKLIPVRVAASATAGCKTRIITINKLGFAIIGKYLHFMVRPVINRSEIFQAGQRLLWSSTYKLKPYGFIYSQDLKNSTDYFSHQIIYIMWSWWARYIRWSHEQHPFLVWYSIIAFPRTIFVPKRFSTESFEFLATRGSLMGDPMSFMTLSLFGLILDRLIKTMHNNFIHSPSLLLGDDYLTILPDSDSCKKASLITKEIGLVLSTKHGYSMRAGVFAEQVITFSAPTLFC